MILHVSVLPFLISKVTVNIDTEIDWFTILTSLYYLKNQYRTVTMKFHNVSMLRHHIVRWSNATPSFMIKIAFWAKSVLFWAKAIFATSQKVPWSSKCITVGKPLCYYVSDPGSIPRGGHTTRSPYILALLGQLSLPSFRGR